MPVTKTRFPRRDAHRYPFFLPDGRHFPLPRDEPGRRSRDPANRIWVGSLNGAAAKPLVATNFNAQYADGYLLFIRGGDLGGSLLAQPFDPSRLETCGEPVTVADQVEPLRRFSRPRRLLRLGRGDARPRFVAAADAARVVRPDRQADGVLRRARGALRCTNFAGRNSRSPFDDLRNRARRRRRSGSATWRAESRRSLTSAPSSNSGPVWSPDGSRIAFQSDRKHQADIFVRSAGGSSAEEAMTDSDEPEYSAGLVRRRPIHRVLRPGGFGNPAHAAIDSSGVASRQTHGARGKGPERLREPRASLRTAGGSPTTWTSRAVARSTRSPFPTDSPSSRSRAPEE